MGIAYNPKIVTNGLVLALDAGNTKSYPGSGTTWTDLSGRGNHSTLTNGPTYSSANKGVMTFDGTDDYVSVPYFPITSQLTASAFVSISSSREGQAVISNWDVYSTSSWLLLSSGLSGQAGKVQLYFKDSTAQLYIVNSGISLSLNTYYYLTFTFNEGMGLLYINGVLVGGIGTISATSLFQNALPMWIGRYTSTYSTGSTSQVTVYNRALSQAEILQNFNTSRGRYGI